MFQTKLSQVKGEKWLSAVNRHYSKQTLLPIENVKTDKSSRTKLHVVELLTILPLAENGNL